MKKNKFKIFSVLIGMLIILSALANNPMAATKDDDTASFVAGNQRYQFHDQSGSYNDGYFLKDYHVHSLLEQEVYVYTKKGERLDIDLASQSVQDEYVLDLDIIDPSGAKKHYHEEFGPGKPQPGEFKASHSVASTKEGIYVIKAMGKRNRRYSLNIKVSNPGGNHKPGRIWSKHWLLNQYGPSPKKPGEIIQKTHNDTWYHKTREGYLYKQDFIRYNGLGFSLESDASGVVRLDDPMCQPVYHDTVVPQKSDIYSPISEAERCGGIIENNNIFLERPDNDLPSHATHPITKQRVFVNPRVVDNKPSISTLNYDRESEDRHGGIISVYIKNHSGSLDLIFYKDNKGDGNFQKIKSVKPTVSTGTNKFHWDGKDSNGKPVNKEDRLKVEAKISRLGEIHFISADVEHREGMTVTALEGINNQGSTKLYFDARDRDIFPIEKSASPYFKYESKTEQQGGYDSRVEPNAHAWQYMYNMNDVYRKRDDYPGKADKPAKPGSMHYIDNFVSLGDGALIDDWTFDPANISASAVFRNNPAIYGSKTVKEINGSPIAGFDDTIVYTIKYYNIGNKKATDVILKDHFKDPKFKGAKILTDDIVAKNNGQDVSRDKINVNGNQMTVDFGTLGVDEQLEVIVPIKLDIPVHLLGEEIVNQAELIYN